jgi:hypothetical protein
VRLCPKISQTNVDIVSKERFLKALEVIVCIACVLEGMAVRRAGPLGRLGRAIVVTVPRVSAMIAI